MDERVKAIFKFEKLDLSRKGMTRLRKTCDEFSRSYKMSTVEDISNAALVPPETTQEERKHYRKVAGNVFRLLLANAKKTQVYRPGKIIIDKMAVISEVCPRELPAHF